MKEEQPEPVFDYADTDKVAMDASPLPELAEKLVAVFESQIAGGNLRW